MHKIVSQMLFFWYIHHLFPCWKIPMVLRLISLSLKIIVLCVFAFDLPVIFLDCLFILESTNYCKVKITCIFHLFLFRYLMTLHLVISVSYAFISVANFGHMSLQCWCPTECPCDISFTLPGAFCAYVNFKWFFRGL
jgi:hypothetical protein